MYTKVIDLQGFNLMCAQTMMKLLPSLSSSAVVLHFLSYYTCAFTHSKLCCALILVMIMHFEQQRDVTYEEAKQFAEENGK